MPKMTDEERQALAQKMDDDFQKFIQERSKSGPADYERDVDKIVESLAQHPAFIKELDYSKPLPPLIEGLQAIKFESDSPEYNAENYKDDGNLHFKRKSYRLAIDNYSKGIQEKCADRLLNAQLYTNRAAAHFHIGNFRSSLIDVSVARKFIPDHVKAIVRGAQCCLELKKYADAIHWCDDGLHLAPTDKQFLDMRAKADKLKRIKERDERKQKAEERKAEAAQQALIENIKKRGVRLADVKKSAGDALILSSLESHHPSGAKVKVDAQGHLVWPVLLTYPEYKETDFITEFNETNTFFEHLHAMFGGEPAPWDEKGHYQAKELLVYFEEVEKEILHPVDIDSTLASALQNEKFLVKGGTPNFHIVSRKSPFTKSFLAHYNLTLPKEKNCFIKFS